MIKPWRALGTYWAQRQEQAALARRAIDERLWRRTIKRFPFLVQGEGREETQLRRMTSLFLDRKEFTGVNGLRITDDMAVAIAAQACLPVLHLGLAAYDSFVGIVVHPGPVRVRREAMDDDGVVHTQDEVLSGEAIQGGPVTLSWRDVRAAGASAAEGYNVVIHEFAHVLDMGDGADNGRPLLPADIAVAEWDTVMGAAFARFCAQVDDDQTTALDPYAAESPAEFFAVASEAFFTARSAFMTEFPQVDHLLARYFRVHDPAPARSTDTRVPEAPKPGFTGL